MGCRGGGRIELAASDVALFREISGDFNPLHESIEFARQTAFGEPVVHGMLSCVAALDSMSSSEGVSRLDVTFRQPLFRDTSYQVEEYRTDSAEARLAVRDGNRTCIDLVTVFGPVTDWTPVEGVPARQRRTPAPHHLMTLASGTTVTGDYGLPDGGCAALAARWPRAAARLGASQLTSLLWCSYLAGMELPGRYAVLCRVSLRSHRPSTDGRLRYAAQVTNVDRRFGMVSVTGVLLSGDEPVAEVDIEAMVHTRVGPPSSELLAEMLPPSTLLAGQTALVVGGSRGLGAAITLALASQGCQVVAAHRGTEVDLVPLVAATTSTAGAVRSLPGDVGQPDWPGQAMTLLDDLGARLNLLVCNAGPTVGPMELRPGRRSRLLEHVAGGLGLVAVPLGGLLPRLVDTGGRCVVVSSSAVVSKPPDWPHYVTLKAAVEGLTGWSAANYPDVAFFLARPGMLVTDQMNMPATRAAADPVEPVAAAIVQRLLNPARPRGEPEVVPMPALARSGGEAFGTFPALSNSSERCPTNAH